jgi:hypothetical protein
MQPFKPLARVRAWPATPTVRRADPRAAGLMAMVAVSFVAVLAASTLVPALTGGGAGRAGARDRLGSAGRAGAVGRPGTGARPGPNGQPEATAHSPATPPPATFAPGGAQGAGPDGAASPADAHGNLASRLDEILRLRERAYARRDATLLDAIYTADCACLRGGRAAIARLLADHAVWRGRSVSVRVEGLSRVSDSLWIAVAVLRRGAFRIEREDGTLLSAEPAARQRYRFALVRTGTRTWLLGHASLVEELPP